MGHEMKLPRGIISVVQTPFDQDGKVDFVSLERLIEDIIAARVDGLLVPAVASEVACLTDTERVDILRTTIQFVAGRVPVIAGASANAPEVCRTHCRVASEQGASACLIAVPAFCYAHPGSTVDFFRQATAANELPLVIQDLEFNGPGLTLQSMKELSDALPLLAGWKIETVPAGPKYTNVRSAFGPDCHISGGWAVPQFIEALDRGIDAMIPESSMIRVYHAIGQFYAVGQRDQAVNLFRKLLPVLSFTNQELATSIAFFKRLLVRKGIFRTESLRIRGFSWDEFNSRIAEELIDHYLELEAGLPDFGTT